MSASKIITSSLTLILLAYIILTGFFGRPSGFIIVLTYIILLPAGLMLLWGIFKLINQITYSHRQAVKEKWGVTGLACFDAMIHMSVADGHLDETEIALIATISQKLFGSASTAYEIKGAAKEVLSKNRPIEDVLHGLDKKLSLEQRSMIIKGAFFVLKADGKADPGERALFSRMVKALNYPSDRLVQLTQDFLDNPE